MEERGGVNLYAFVNNAPVDLIDPLGEFPTSPGGLGGTVRPYPNNSNPDAYVPNWARRNWTFNPPSMSFTTGQSVSFRGCVPAGGPVWVCFTGGWTIRVGNCCKDGQKKGYTRVEANASVTAQVGLSSPFGVSYTKPVIENLGQCPQEGGSASWNLQFSLRLGPAVGQATYSAPFDTFLGGRWSVSGSLSFTSFSGVNVQGGGGVRGSFVKLGEARW
jgi:hypothetical protein